MRHNLSKIAIALIMLASTATAFAQSAGCHIAGPDNAKLTIEEYADFECPFCARGASTMKQALKDYKGKIKLVYRNLPLPFHTHAKIAAQAFAAVCLQSPSLAGTFANELFENQSELQEKGEVFLEEVAQKIGVDVDKMKSDMNGPEVEKSLADDQVAAKSHSFQGTPSFLIGKTAITGALPYMEIKQAIDKELGN